MISLFIFSSKLDFDGLNSTLIFSKDQQLLRITLAPDDMFRIPIQADEISPTLKKAVLAYEDHYFYWHPGINFYALGRALIANIKAGEIVQGGSTITMQLARMMNPKPRTVKNKLFEMVRAMQLELHHSKQEILTFYFNQAPYGGNLVGVSAASYFYFKKNPKHLSLGEAALLAAIPNNPNGLRPDLNSEAARHAREKVLNILRQRGKITAAEMEEALSETIPSARFDLPFEIPHLATTLLEKYPQKNRLYTTIDLRVQKLAERLLKDFLRPLQKRNIHNGAVVILKNQTHDVLALVGSVDFFDVKIDGQVNGALASRSPGSALKPFVYAQGIEHGIISPQGILYDVPVEYSGYKPVNYDDTFHGVVTVEEALTRSLNVPAVNLYAQLGEDGIYSFLKEAGISTLPNAKDYYGLSLILGGCGVTLLELTNLYTGLANGGKFKPYRLLSEEEIFEEEQVLSEGTCYIISEMLSQVRRPELPASWEYSVNMPKVAWKTGTSYGHRDAWSIGYTPNYTIGVWVGNFDATGVPELIGAEVAAPILFSLFNAVEKFSENRWFVQPETVKRRQVCAISGMVRSEFCAAVKDELFLPGLSPAQQCNIHQQIFVDKKTGKRLCSSCRRGRDYSEKIVEQWPPEIATWMVRHGFPLDEIPEHFPDCPKILAGKKPIILSPTEDTAYKLRSSVDKKYQKILLDATVSNDTKKIYWFYDGRLVSADVPTKKVFIVPEAGKHRVICSDDLGRSSMVEFTVQ